MFTKDDFALRRGAIALGAASLLGLAGCGGGPTFNRSASDAEGALDVRVSAGGPVSGATVTVYAVADGTGQVNALVGNLGVLGAGGPTDAAGKATVKLAVKSYSGPIQVVAGGANLTYPDPTVTVLAGKPATVVQIPSTFVLSSYLAQYKTGTSAVVPITLVTTLADHGALAFARGLHPLHPGAKTLGESLAARDSLWVSHFATSANAWNPSSLRSTTPASFTDSATTLVDAAYAALFDLALNQLARDTALRAGYGAGSSAITAITLAQFLEQDLDADAVLNGKGGAGAAIVTQGTTPVALDSQFLRKPLAQALDTWIQNAGLNLSGVHQADLIGAQVYSAVATDPSDLFGDPPAGAYDPVDRSPPVVALVAEPALYTNASSMKLTVTASDPSGVAGVYVRAGGQRYPAALQNDGTWQVTVNLPSPGHNITTIWAVDQSPSANSGEDSQPPYQLTRDVLLDTTPPSATYDQGFASYYDERNMQVGAQTPPAYTIGPKAAVQAGGDFFKVATRLSAGVQATAAEFETTNAQNIPLLRFAVQLSAQIDSPISRATYTISVRCPAPCPAFPDKAGTLLVSPTATDQAVYFLLPLSTEYVPALGSLQGPAQLTVTVGLADAAGNQWTSSPWTFTFHVIGPPLVVREDASYAAANDGKSSFPYRMNQANYATLYDPSATIFSPENTIRLVHYIIINPASQPVALGPSLAGAVWSDNETWVGAATSVGHVYYSPQAPCGWIVANTGVALPADMTPATVQYSPCAGSSKSFTAPGGSPQCETDPGAATISGSQTSATLATNAYYQPYGVDAGSAPVTAFGRYIVPAASGSSPGILSLYVVRPRVGLPARIPLTGWNGLQYIQDIGQEATQAQVWIRTSYNPPIGPCDYSQRHPGDYSQVWMAPVYQDNLVHYSRTLTAAADGLAGTLSLQTAGLGASGAEFGEVQTIPGGTLDLTRTIAH